VVLVFLFLWGEVLMFLFLGDGVLVFLFVVELPALQVQTLLLKNSPSLFLLFAVF
jgi:hypothetical protein